MVAESVHSQGRPRRRWARRTHRFWCRRMPMAGLSISAVLARSMIGARRPARPPSYISSTRMRFTSAWRVVGQDDPHAGIQEGEFAQPVLASVAKSIFGLGEGRGRGQEGDLGAALGLAVLDRRRPEHSELVHGIAMRLNSIAMNHSASSRQMRSFERFRRQRVDDRGRRHRAGRPTPYRRSGRTLPPACSWVMMTSAADICSSSCRSTGMRAAIVGDGHRIVGIQRHRHQRRHSHPAPRRSHCRRPHRPCDAGPTRHRCRRYTCRAACGPHRAPAAP